MLDAQVHVVVDNGTGYMKSGFSGEEAPRSVFPTMISIPIKDKALGTELKPRLIGQESLEKIGMSNEIPLIEDGKIINWEEMEKIWHSIFYNELRIAPEEHNIILTDVPLNEESNREKMTQTMFEKFKTPGMFISMTSLMSMYSAGKTAGIVVDSGETISNFVPVYEGFAFPHAIGKIQMGGRDVTEFLIRLVVEKNKYNTKDKTRFQRMNDIKEKYCFVSYDFDADLREADEGGALETKVKLPDGEELTLCFDRIRCTEALFRPSFIDKNNIKGLHDECNSSIQKTDIEIRKDLYSNIVLSGGNTLFQGLPERLTREIQRLTPSAASNKVKVVALPERKYATWIGASILSSLSNFQCMWITKAEYDEEGPGIVHKKCF